MRYLRIKNQGVMSPEAIHLVGASTKRNEPNKIGQFGSGNKYALAYLLRNHHELQIFAGQQPIELTTVPTSFRDQTFEVIHVNGERTSITTEMGKDWELWQALREIYCNALDEGGCSMDFVQEIMPLPDETHFYIRNNAQVMEFAKNFDNYIAVNKKVFFECDKGRILEKSGDTCNIYRRGIRCFNTNKTSMYDYDFNEITIDENRLVKYPWQVEERLWELLFRCDNREVIMGVLHNSSRQEMMEGCISDYSDLNASAIGEEFKSAISTVNLAPKSFAGLLKPDEHHNHIVIPTKVFDAARAHLTDEQVGDRFKVDFRGGAFREVEFSLLHAQALKDALYFLNEVNFPIDQEVVCAIFESKSVMGCAYQGKIYLSDLCLDKGINEVVNTLIEEHVHLKYDVRDETRGFQTAIISEFIAYMKRTNSFSI